MTQLITASLYHLQVHRADITWSCLSMEHALQHGDCPFGTGCSTRHDAKSSSAGASQNIIRKFQYRVLSKVHNDLKR